jgi:hypothetical protein
VPCSAITVRALRAAVVVPLLAASALVASVGHASATINTNDTDRPKISAGGTIASLRIAAPLVMGAAIRDPGRRDSYGTPGTGSLDVSATCVTRGPAEANASIHG